MRINHHGTQSERASPIQDWITPGSSGCAHLGYTAYTKTAHRLLARYYSDDTGRVHHEERDVIRSRTNRTGLTLLLSVAAIPAAGAQTASPAASTTGIALDQARQAAEREAAAREARDNAPQAGSSAAAPSLGAFPVETPCFTIKKIVIDTALPRGLKWVPHHLTQFEGRCAGHGGLNYVLKSLEAAFLNRGLVTTRAGLPEQDMASGTLHIAVIPGIVTAVRGGTRRSRRSWAVASPIHKGDLVNLRGLEQGLEQMRRVPGTQVAVDLAPGSAPGETIFDLKAKLSHPVTGSISLNNFAGGTVGRWQASGQASALNLLGLNEVLSGSYNSRTSNPSIPANSTSSGVSFSVPWGWWTFGVSANASLYTQHVIGQVEDFDTRGTVKTVSGYVERVVHRDRISKTSLQIQAQRRWGRNYISGIEIGLQHQDLADIQVALIDRHSFGAIRVNSEIAYRFGTGLFGAQQDEPDQPAELPSARYRIATADISLSAPLGKRLGYSAAFRGQFSNRPLYGSDQFSVGGPYTVRGYDSDRALIGKTGWYMRQELSFSANGHLQPYGLIDTGHIKGSGATPIGVGAGLRAQAHGANLDAFVAIPVTAKTLAGSKLAQIGVSVGFGF